MQYVLEVETTGHINGLDVGGKQKGNQGITYFKVLVKSCIQSEIVSAHSNALPSLLWVR